MFSLENPFSDNEADRFKAVDRGLGIRNAYVAGGWGDSNCDVTTATDLVADILRSMPEDEWYTVLRSAVLHAHEEIHGWGSAEELYLAIEGLKTDEGMAA